MMSTVFNAKTQSRKDAEKIENKWASLIVDAAIEVHTELGGPGLLESLYEEALLQELKLRNIPVVSQVHLPVVYKDYTLRNPLRIDLLVDHKVIIEVKAFEQELAVHRSQLLTYLRITRLKLGLLINFGQKYLRNGITRVVNGL